MENLILITSLVRLSMAGVQLILRCLGRSPAGVPVDDELAGINSLLRVGLPLHIDPSWTDDFNPVVLLEARPNWGP